MEYSEHDLTDMPEEELTKLVYRAIARCGTLDVDIVLFEMLKMLKENVSNKDSAFKMIT